LSGPFIQAEHLSRRYGRRWAVADVSFAIDEGDVLILAGANGSGKTTLLRLLATAIRSDHGTLRIGGFDARTHREDIRRFSALLGHASYLYEALTARENLDVFASHLGRGAEAIPSLLERVGLAERAHDLVATFSAGMRKRLSFARLLLQTPRLALIDEPYGALDPSGFALVDELVRELKASGATVVMATHQLERGRALGDAFLSLEQGRIAAA
jgi:heme exporter protein A